MPNLFSLNTWISNNSLSLTNFDELYLHFISFFLKKRIFLKLNKLIIMTCDQM